MSVSRRFDSRTSRRATSRDDVLRFPTTSRARPIWSSVAFRREQQAMVDSWVSWCDTIVGAVSGGSGATRFPVIATRWSPARAFIDGGMAQAVRAQEARRRTLTVYTDVRRVTDALAIDDTDTVTVLLIDSDGRLRWRTTGPVTERAGSDLLALTRR